MSLPQEYTVQMTGLRGPGGTVTTDLAALEANVVEKSDAAGASASRAQAWAESDTAPDPADLASKSAKTWAGVAETSALALGPNVPFANPSPAAGTTTNTSTGSVVLSTPMSHSGRISRLKLYAQAAGTVYVSVYRPPAGVTVAPGVTVTRAALVGITVAAGLNDLSGSSLPAIPVQAGDVVGVAGNGILRYTAVSAGGPRYYIMAGDTTTVTALVTDNRWEYGFEVQYDFTTDTSLGQAVADLQDETDALAEEVSANALALGPTVAYSNPSPVAGTTTNTTGGSVVLSTPMPRDGRISRLKLYAAIAGNVFISVYRPPAGVTPAPGVTMTRVSLTSIAVVAGSNDLSDALPNISVQAGDLVGITGIDILQYTSVPAGGPRYYIMSGNNPTISALASDTRWEHGFEVQYDFATDTALGQAVADLQDATTEWQPTSGYILVFGVGQSNMAGRATTPSEFSIEAGRSYKYDLPTNALTALADPTGTDSTAQTGRTSLGPAMAQAVLEATNGRIGVIFVNAAVGGMPISTWASGGSSWTPAVTMYGATIADILAKKLNVVGCVGAFIQGESDAADNVPGATWKAAVLDLLGRMRTLTGCAKMPLIMSQIGIDTTAPTSSGYAAIRLAQSELAGGDNGIFMAHAGAKYFADRGLMMDNVHYLAAAYDEIGGDIGEAVVRLGIGLRPSGLD